jgi:hypothetical protein
MASADSYGPSPDSFATASTLTVPLENTDFSLTQDQIGYTDGYVPPSGLVVPDASVINLPGQIPGIPGGGASNGGIGASDPSGINVLHADPSVNPTPTGGYVQALASIAASASSAFTTYVKGSPSVGIPAARRPLGTPSLGGALSLTTPQGTTNWTTVAILIALMGVGGFLLYKYA